MLLYWKADKGEGEDAAEMMERGLEAETGKSIVAWTKKVRYSFVLRRAHGMVLIDVFLLTTRGKSTYPTRNTTVSGYL
jgi:hypothetical protein